MVGTSVVISKPPSSHRISFLLSIYLQINAIRFRASTVISSERLLCLNLQGPVSVLYSSMVAESLISPTGHIHFGLLIVSCDYHVTKYLPGRSPLRRKNAIRIIIPQPATP